MLQDELASAVGISKSQLSKFKARGCPVDDEGKARIWIAGHIKPRAKRKKLCPDPDCGETCTVHSKEEPAPPDQFSWEKRLERARKTELDIYDAIQKALTKNELPQLQSLLSSYTKSFQSIAEAESTALEARTQTGELIHRDTAKAIMVEMLQPIRASLDLLPITERSRCNPQQPEVAEAVLRTWKDALLLRLSQADTKF